MILLLIASILFAVFYTHRSTYALLSKYNDGSAYVNNYNTIGMVALVPIIIAIIIWVCISKGLTFTLVLIPSIVLVMYLNHKDIKSKLNLKTTSIYSIRKDLTINEVLITAASVVSLLSI